MRPSDLIKLKEASKLVSRSEATIRRWVRDDHLTKYIGDHTGRGGSPPMLVSTAQVLARAGIIAESQPGDHEPKAEGVHPSVQPSTSSEHLVQVALLQGEVNTLQARLEASEALVARLEQQVISTGQEVQQARSVAEDWKDRHDAAAAERDALRATRGGSWWTRLLTG